LFNFSQAAASHRIKQLMPNHSLERTRPRRRDAMKESWPGRSARDRYPPLAAAIPVNDIMNEPFLCFSHRARVFPVRLRAMALGQPGNI